MAEPGDSSGSRTRISPLYSAVFPESPSGVNSSVAELGCCVHSVLGTGLGLGSQG